MNRRETLRATAILGSTALAGCLYAGAGEGCRLGLAAEGFTITNFDDTAHTLSITATRELVVHTKEVFADSYELGPESGDSSSLDVSDVVEIAGPHVLELELETGASMDYLWEVTTDRCDALRITVENGAITVSEAGDSS